MLQQGGQLCFAAMKLAHWPTLSLRVSRTLWPRNLKGLNPTSMTFSCTSSTMAKAREARPESSSTAKLDSGQTKQPEKQSRSDEQSDEVQLVPPKEELNIRGADLDAVMRVRSLTTALNLASKFTSDECLKALQNLANTRTRPVLLIEKLVHGVSKSVDEFDLKQLSDLLFCLSRLSFVDEALLPKVCAALITAKKEKNASPVLGSSISSLQRLRWKDPMLLDDLSVWIHKNLETFRNPTNFIYTLALMNHSPQNLDSLLPMVWKDVSSSSANPIEKLNFLWSIAVLNSETSKKILKDNLEEIFKPSFLEFFGSAPQMIPQWVKICNLHAASKFKNIKLTVPENLHSDVMKFSEKNDKTLLVSKTQDILFKDMDPQLYSTFVPTTMGFPIDLVCNLDNRRRAVPLNINSPSCTKVAVMVCSYHDTCQPTKEPLGFKRLEQRLLEQRNFKVVCLPYHVLSDGYSGTFEYFESSLKSIVRD